jgi:hypothetical protein
MRIIIVTLALLSGAVFFGAENATALGCPSGQREMGHCGPQTAVSRCSVRKEAQAHQAPTSGSFGEGRAGGDLDCDSEELQRQSYDYL